MISSGLKIALSCAMAASSLLLSSSAHASEDVVRATTSYTAADAALAGDVLVWSPSFTVGLQREDEIDVIAYGAGSRRATFVGSTYGRQMPSFTIAQKGFADRWAARPVTHPTEALVGVVPITLGEPGAQRSVRARVFANCRQSDSGSPRRCQRQDVQRHGGAVELVARGVEADAGAATPEATSVRIDGTGLSYGQLLRIAGSLRPTR